jgi:O-antigen/teichoic acid export membrane protein
MSVSRKVAYNVVVSSAAKILSTVFALIGIGLITRYLGQEGFGVYTTALAFLAFFGALGDWGIYQVATREISRPKSNEKYIIANAMGIRIAVCVGIVLITPVIVYFLPYSTELKIAIIIVSFSYVFSSLYQTLIGLFQKRLIMDRVTIAEFASKAIQVALIYIGIKMNLGFYFIIGTLLVNMIISFTVIFLLSRKFIKFKPAFDFSYWKKFLAQSIPLGLSVAVTFLYFKADIILLSLMKPAEDVGVYGAAYKVIENISFFPAMIVGLVMPMMAYNIFKDREKFKFLVEKNFKVFVILVIPLIIGTWFLADGIINIIAGSAFATSALLLKILIFALAFIFFGHLFTNVLIVAKLQKQLLTALIICAVFNITLNLIFIPQYSYYATSVISVGTELLVAVLTGFVMVKNLKFFPRVNKLFFIFLSGALMIAYLRFLQGQNFFLLLVTSPVIYFSALLISKAISRKEIMSLVKKN